MPRRRERIIMMSKVAAIVTAMIQYEMRYGVIKSEAKYQVLVICTRNVYVSSTMTW